MAYLKTTDLDNLSDAVYNEIGYSQTQRRLFLSTVNPQFRASLAVDNSNDKAQLEMDLIRFNDIARLSDGTIPLENWLERVARQAKPFPLSNELVQRALDTIAKKSGESINNPQAPDQHIIDKVVQEKSIHRNDMLSYAFLESGFKAGIAVGQVLVPRYENQQPLLDNGKPVQYRGTGWLIGRDLIITNKHVINARSGNEPPATEADLRLQAANSLIHFDFNAHNLQGTYAKCIELLASDTSLDYAILKIETQPLRHPLPLLAETISISAENVPVVNIIQHPFGDAKKVALRNNHIFDAHYPKLRYFTDTEGGSSGAPVFNDQWQVIALHRASTIVDNVKYNGQTTAWVNEGVQIEAILSHVKSHFPNLSNAI